MDTTHIWLILLAVAALAIWHMVREDRRRSKRESPNDCGCDGGQDWSWSDWGGGDGGGGGDGD